MSMCCLLPFFLVWALQPTFGRAAIVIPDLSDQLDHTAWAADNALPPDWNVANVASSSTVQGEHVLTNERTEQDQEYWNTTQNGTSVVVVDNGAALHMTWSNIVKSGHGMVGDSLAQQSGHNAAVNVANRSSAAFDFCNITTHNGAVGIFSSGSDSSVTLSRSSLYGTGPLGHSLFSVSGSTISATSIFQYTGGSGSSAFAVGDNGSVTAVDSVAHTFGVGSTIWYGTGAGGQLSGQRVYANADNSSVAVLDGSHRLTISDSVLTANGPAGVIATNSLNQVSAASIQLNNTWLVTHGELSPAFWFGNTNATVELYHARLQTDSDVLAVANRSQMTPDYSAFGASRPGASPSPATVRFDVSYSNLQGDLVAYLGSWITFVLRSSSIWTGGTYPVGMGDSVSGVDVVIARDCQWFVAHDSRVQSFWDEDVSMGNVFSNGHSIYYNKSAPLNGWLEGKTVSLQGGGSAVPF